VVSHVQCGEWSTHHRTPLDALHVGELSREKLIGYVKALNKDQRSLSLR
jgi:hypothetical protein